MPPNPCRPHSVGTSFVFLVQWELDPRTPGSPFLLQPITAPRDRRAAVGLAGPVWAGLGPPLLPSQLLLLTCILSGGLWWGSDVCSLARIGSNAAQLARSLPPTPGAQGHH